MQAGASALPDVLTLEHRGAILSTLVAAMVNDPNNPGSRSEAEEVLRTCEGLYGYCDVLCHLFASGEIDENARLMALLCLHTAVKRHWRPARQSRNAPPVHNMAEDEKARLRAFLLSHMQEPHPLLARNLAYVLARVVRLDWPKEWTDFFHSLLPKLSDGPPLQTLRATYSMHRVIKSLATKVLMADKRAFRDMAQLLFPLVYQQLWRPRMRELIAALQSGDVGCLGAEQVEQLVSMTHVAKTCTKIIYFLVANHVECLDGEVVAGFFTDHHACLPTLLHGHRALVQQHTAQAHTGGGPPLSVLHGLAKLLKHLALVMVDTQKKAPLAVRAFLPAYLQLFYDELETVASGPQASALLLSSDPADPSRYFYLHCTMFLANVISCADYAPDQGSGDARSIKFAGEAAKEDEWTREAQAAVVGFFSPPRCVRLCELLLQHLMGTRPDDVDLWLSSPEELILDEEQRKADEDMRAAAEHLFLTLWDARRDLIAPSLIGIATNAAAQVAAASSATITQEVLLMDRVYLSLGLVSFSLSEHMDLTQWFSGVFQPVASALLCAPQPRRPPVLLRRLVYLIACLGTSMPAEAKPIICQFLVSILDPSNQATDLLVALQAMEALHNFVNDWDFVRREDDLGSLLGPCLGHVYSILAACHELSNKKKVFDFLNDLIEALGPSSASFASMVASPLSAVWDACPDGCSPAFEGGGSSELRSCVLHLLKTLLPKLGPASQEHLHPLVLPLIDVATDPTRPEHVALLEDGLALWQVVVRNANRYEEGSLGVLLPRLPVILDTGLEHLRGVMNILEDCLLLGGDAFMAVHLPTLCACLAQSATRVVERGAAYVTRMLEVLLVAYPSRGAEALLESHVLSALLQSCATAAGGGQGQGGGVESEVVVVQHLTVLARVLLTSPSTFARLLAASGVPVLPLVDMMLSLFDQVCAGATGPWRRKTWCLALTSLLTGQLGDRHVVGGMLERLPQVVNVCVDVMAEEAMENGKGQGEGDESLLIKMRQTGSRDDQAMQLLMQMGALGELDEDTTTGDLTARFKPFVERDMVNQTTVVAFLRSSLEACSAAVGAEAVQSALNAVDPVIMQQLGAI